MRSVGSMAMLNVVIEKKALEILADAVDRTVGTGFVHAAVLKAAQTLAAHDYRQADKAFRMLNPRSEEHTSELQSLMRISYAVFCLKKKKTKNKYTDNNTSHKKEHSSV